MHLIPNIFACIVIVMHHQDGIWIKFGTIQKTQNVSIIYIFKNNIIIADGEYFSYEFLNFLINKNLKFIIRIKRDVNNLNPLNELKRNVPNYNLVSNIRKYIRFLKYNNIF